MGLLGEIAGFLGLGEEEAEGRQDTTVRAAPRTEEAGKLWDTFMANFGKLGDVYAGQEAALGPEVDEYTGLLSKLIGGPQYKQFGVSLGGQDPIMFTPRSNIASAESQAGLGRERLATEGKYAPGWSKLAFLDYLTPLLMETEKLRYGIPSTSTTAQASGYSSAGALSDIGSIASLGANLGSAGGAKGLLSSLWGK